MKQDAIDSKIAIRIDDIGASSKMFEVYSKNIVGNLFFLKYLKLFKAWGCYPEMTVEHWERTIELANKYNAKITVGVTATWVERDGSMIPYPEKYPKQAEILKQAMKDNLIEIANHGLTHCIVGKHLPRLVTSNRKYHREFWDWIPKEVHFEHLKKSQKIFQQWLGDTPVTLIPPGNVYSVDTLEAAELCGIEQINSYMNHEVDSSVRIINNNLIDAFHDRELVLLGMEFLETKLLNYYGNSNFTFVKDL